MAYQCYLCKEIWIDNKFDIPAMKEEYIKNNPDLPDGEPVSICTPCGEKLEEFEKQKES